MQQWLERWRELRGALVWALGRFPVSAIALAIYALYVNLEIAEAVITADETLARAGFALVGGAALAAATALFGERYRIAAIPRHLASLVLAAVVGAALWYWDRLGVAFPALLTATVLAIPLAPYVRREASGFWAFVWHLIHAAALALIAIVVFCLGLSAIFASIDYLFGVNIDSSVYGHVWAIGLGFVGPLFALSLVPTAFPEQDAPEAGDVFVAGIRILSDFVAVPLLTAYVAILHLYALKIAIEGALPKGQIGWMVLSFGLAVLALRVVVHPMAGLSRTPTRLFLKYWAVGLVVPLGLLVIALYERVSAYGVTPERYALGLFTLFLAVVLLAQLHPRLRGDIRIIPAVGALALFAASFGPWGMFAVSARSQMDRLMQHLTAAGAIEDGVLTKKPRFPQTTAEDVRSIVSVLQETRQIDRLRPLFAGKPDDPFADATFVASRWDSLNRFWDALNVKSLPPVSEEGVFTISSNPGATTIKGYDLVVSQLTFYNAQRVDAAFDGVALRVHIDGTTIEIAAEDRMLRVTPNLLRNAVAERLEAVEKRLPETERPSFLVELALEGKRIALRFNVLSGKLNDNEFSLSGGSFDLFLRRADWTGGSGGEPAQSPDP